MTYNGTFSNFCWKMWQLWWDHWSNNWRRFRKKYFYHFYLSQLFSFGQLWNSPVTCRYFKNVFIKVLTIMTLVQIVEACQNLSHLRPLFFKPSKLANFIAKFSINLEFCYKSVLGLSWGHGVCIRIVKM